MIRASRSNGDEKIRIRDFGRLRRMWNYNIKMYLIQEEWYGVESSRSEYRPAGDSCEHGN
jgi:hypothetical protein